MRWDGMRNLGTYAVCLCVKDRMRKEMRIFDSGASQWGALSQGSIQSSLVCYFGPTGPQLSPAQYLYKMNYGSVISEHLVSISQSWFLLPRYGDSTRDTMKVGVWETPRQSITIVKLWRFCIGVLVSLAFNQLTLSSILFGHFNSREQPKRRQN